MKTGFTEKYTVLEHKNEYLEEKLILYYLDT